MLLISSSRTSLIPTGKKSKLADFLDFIRKKIDLVSAITFKFNNDGGLLSSVLFLIMFFLKN